MRRWKTPRGPEEWVWDQIHGSSPCVRPFLRSIIGCKSKTGQHIEWEVTACSPFPPLMCDLPCRPNDHSTEGFNRWEFMTAHCWGERPAGEWTLELQDSPSRESERAEPGLRSVFAPSQC